MNKSKRSTSESAALNTFIKLMRATESVSSDVHRQITASGLSISQFGILEALYHLGPMAQKDLAEKILKSAGNITMVIDNLEKQGLVVRDRNDLDRRSFIISPTIKGEALIADILPQHAERIKKRMSSLTLKEQQTLGRLLKKLGQSTEKP